MNRGVSEPVAGYYRSTMRGADIRHGYSAIDPQMNLEQQLAELSPEARHDLNSYLEGQGLAERENVLVLPSNRHFFYSDEELKEQQTVINLKLLNYVRHIREFLTRVSELISSDCSFVGCFIDNRYYNGFGDKYSRLPGDLSRKAEAYENGIESRIPFINRMYSFIDMKTNRYLTVRSVTSLMEQCGLHVINTTEINGIVYFHTRKRTAQIGLIA